MRGTEDRPHRLVVEGADDLNVTFHLLKASGYDWNTSEVHIEDAKGKPKMLPQVSPTVKSYRRSAFVLDADIDVSATWRSLSGKLADAEISLPPGPQDGGTILSNHHHMGGKIGVWVMPDNQGHGTLENFLETLVPASDRLWPFACKSTRDAKEHDSKYRDSDERTCCLHAWLSWQRVPGCPFGTAVTARFFDTDVEATHRFVAWFHSVFST